MFNPDEKLRISTYAVALSEFDYASAVSEY